MFFLKPAKAFFNHRKNYLSEAQLDAIKQISKTQFNQLFNDYESIAMGRKLPDWSRVKSATDWLRETINALPDEIETPTKIAVMIKNFVEKESDKGFALYLVDNLTTLKNYSVLLENNTTAAPRP